MCMRQRVLDISRNTEPRNFRNKKERYEGKLIDGGQSVDTSQSRQWRINHLSVERGIIHRLKLVLFSSIGRDCLIERVIQRESVIEIKYGWSASLHTCSYLSAQTNRRNPIHRWSVMFSIAVIFVISVYETKRSSGRNTQIFRMHFRRLIVCSLSRKRLDCRNLCDRRYETMRFRQYHHIRSRFV